MTTEEQLLAESEKTNKLLAQLVGKSGSSNSGGGNSGGGNSGGSSNPLSAVASTLGEFATTVATGGKKVWEGSAKLADGFDAVAGALQRHGGAVGQFVGTLGKELGTAVLDVNDWSNKNAQVGAGFNNNIAEMDKQVKGARMTHEEYNALLKDNVEKLGGLGSTTQRAQENFLKFSKGMQESGVSTKLQEMGMSAEEITKVSLAAMQHQRGMDMSSDVAQRKAIESAEAMAVSMEENTRITGLSRKAQMDDLEKRNSDVVTQVALSRLDPEAKKRHDDSMMQMQGMSAGVKNLFTETVTGGIRSKEGQAAMAALGPAGPELQKAAIAMKEANTPEKRAAADKQLQSAMVAVDKWQNSDGFKDMVQYGKGGVTDAAKEQYGGNLEREKVNAKIAEAKTGGVTLTPEEARKQIHDEVQKESAGKNRDGSAPTDSQEVARDINKANRLSKDMAAGLGQEFGTLTTAVKKVTDKFTGLDAALAPLTQEQAAPSKLIGKAGTSLLDKFHAGSLGEASRRAAEKRSDNMTPDQIANPPGFASGTPEFNKFLNGGGSFSDMFTSFDPAGTPAILHGKELVANEDQMKQFIQQMNPSNKSATQDVNIKDSATAAIGSNIANQIKPLQNLSVGPEGSTLPTSTDTTTPPAVPDITSSFTSINKELANTTKQLSEVAEKLKNVSFEPAAKTFSEKITSVFDKINPTEIAKQAAIQPKPVEKPVEKPTVKPEEKKAEPAKPVEVKVEIPKEEKKAEPAKPKEEKKEEPAKPKEEKPAEKKEENAATVKKSETHLTDLNSVLQEVTRDIYVGGEKTKESAARMASLGPAGADFEKSVNAYKNATTDKQRSEAMQSELAAKAKIKEYQASSEYAAKVQFQTAAISKEKPPEPVIKTTEDLNKFLFGSLKPTEVKPADKKDDKKEEKPVEKVEAKLPEPKKDAADIDKAKVAVKDDKIIEEGKSRISDMETMKKHMETTTTKLSENISNSSKLPDLMPTFKGLSDQVGGVITNALPEQTGPTDIIKLSDEFKPPNYADVFTNLNKTLDTTYKADEKEEDTSFFSDFPDVSNMFSDVKDKLSGTIKTDVIPPEDKDKPKEENGFFDSLPSVSGMFGDIGKSISNTFKGDDKPAFAKGNVKYGEISPEEVAASEKRSQEGIGKVETDPAILKDLNAERARQADPTRYKQKEPANPETATVKKPEVPKQDPKLAEMYKKFGLETFNDFNARTSAEVKQAHAQIKDVSKDKASLSKQDVTPPKPAEPHKPADHAAAAVQPAVAAPVLASKETTLKDIHDVLMQLNKTMAEMAHHTDQINHNSQKQVKATKGLTDNRWAQRYKE